MSSEVKQIKEQERGMVHYVYSGGKVSAIGPEFITTPRTGGNINVTVPFNTFIFAIIVLLNAILVLRVMVVSGKLKIPCSIFRTLIFILLS